MYFVFVFVLFVLFVFFFITHAVQWQIFAGVLFLRLTTIMKIRSRKILIQLNVPVAPRSITKITNWECFAMSEFAYRYFYTREYLLFYSRFIVYANGFSFNSFSPTLSFRGSMFQANLHQWTRRWH